jgi:hypothetical protein
MRTRSTIMEMLTIFRKVACWCYDIFSKMSHINCNSYLGRYSNTGTSEYKWKAQSLHACSFLVSVIGTQNSWRLTDSKSLSQAAALKDVSILHKHLYPTAFTVHETDPMFPVFLLRLEHDPVYAGTAWPSVILRHFCFIGSWESTVVLFCCGVP